jgi:Predicted exporters of the RND superfamily
MQPESSWPRGLVIAGLAAIALGTLDPLEGSVVILGGIALVTIGAFLAHSPLRSRMYTVLALAVIGVGALWGVSAMGGIGGKSGRSMWWAVTMLPYPVAWVLGIAGAIQLLRRKPASA